MRSTSLETTIYYHQKWEDGKQLTIRHYLDIKRSYLIVKRGMDVAISSLVLLLLAPWLFPIIIALIKLDSKGPAFFRQKRVGFLGRTFWCYKFRTMVSDADKLKADLEHMNERDSVLFKISNDPRITRMGRILRKYSLDELPQFYNVLKGDMSLVGPRPDQVDQIRYYDQSEMRKLSVKPGITTKEPPRFGVIDGNTTSTDWSHHDRP